MGKIKSILIITLFFFLSKESFCQEANLDWKLHDVGTIRQVVTNRGGLNAKGDNSFDFRGLVNSEHPPNSGMEHMTNSGLWVAAVMDGIRSVTKADGEGGNSRECYPTNEPWDTVWAVDRRGVVDIPYWPGYEGISDQDFVCRYNDYGPVSQRISEHRPLMIDIIQTSHAWATPPLDETIVVNYYVISTEKDLQDVYIGVYLNGNVGYVFDDRFGLDDESFFRDRYKTQYARDVPGGPDGSATILGEKFFPQSTPNLKTTYIWWNGVKGAPQSRDNDAYIELSSGEIMEDQVNTGDGTKSLVMFGPYKNLNVGDTLKLTMAIIMGETEKEINDKGILIEQIRARDYKIPSPPPSPKISLIPGDRTIKLDWTPKIDQPNPEEFEDPDRGDGVVKPFEGYRVYKSTKSNSGPWTLLAQFDVDNNYGQNTGIKREFIDDGLLNNIEYFYTVTAYTLPDNSIDFPELESSKTTGSITAIPGTPPPETVGKVAVVPNPYRGDIAYYAYNPPWERPPGSRQWLEQDRRIQFINLPPSCKIRIYTLAGELVYELDHFDSAKGYDDWNLTSSVGQAISSGIYLYTVEDLNTGEVQVDKFVVIK